MDLLPVLRPHFSTCQQRRTNKEGFQFDSTRISVLTCLSYPFSTVSFKRQGHVNATNIMKNSTTLLYACIRAGKGEVGAGNESYLLQLFPFSLEQEQ